MSQPNPGNRHDRPVIAVNDRGLTLGVDADGVWVIWNKDDTARPAPTVWPAHDHLMWLLPLLQKPQQVVVKAVTAADADGELLPSVVRFALESWSDYWAGLALGWLEAGYPSTGLLDTLHALKTPPDNPNPSDTEPSACGGRQQPPNLDPERSFLAGAVTDQLELIRNASTGAGHDGPQPVRSRQMLYTGVPPDA